MSSNPPTTGYAHPVPPPRVEQRPEAQNEPKPKDLRTDGQLRRDIEHTRNELAKTLDALEYKLDVPARGAEFVDASKRQLSKQWDDNPLLVAGIAVGAAVAVAGAVLGGIMLFRRGA